jgi:outer membrane protein assembly factor BamB
MQQTRPARRHRGMGSKLAALVVAAGEAASAGSAGIGLPAWSQFHYDAAHTGYNRAERTLTRTNVRKLRKAWSVVTGAAIEGSPAVTGNLVFAGSDDGMLHAYRLDGAEAWSSAVGGVGRFVASPAIGGQSVFGYASDSVVTALDAGAGAPRWSDRISEVQGAFPGSPTVAGGLVYAVPYELVALDQETGAVRWVRPNVGCFLCSPAVASGTLYIGGGPAVGKKLLALDAATGAERWAFRPRAGRNFGWSASPAVSGGRVFQAAFVAGGGKKAYSLYAFSASSGKRLWKARVGSSQFLTSSSPAVASGVVFYVSPGKRIYALRASTGKVLWSKAIDPSASSPAVAGGVVYFGAGITMYGLDTRNGKTLWHARTSSDPSDPAVFDGTLYVGSGDGTLYAYRVPVG